MDLEGLEGLDSFTLARRAQVEAKRRALMPPMAPPTAPTPRGIQDADQARAVQTAWEDGWNAGRSAGWQEGWDLRTAVDVVVWYVNRQMTSENTSSDKVGADRTEQNSAQTGKEP